MRGQRAPALAGQVDQPRFAGAQGSVRFGIVSPRRRRNPVRWDGIEDALGARQE